MSKPFKDLTGLSFGKLTVLSLDKDRTLLDKERQKKGEIKRTNTYWICQCSCRLKTIKSVRTSHLLAGSVSSCGCACGGGKKNYFEEKDDYIIMFDSKKKNSCIISKQDLEEVSKYCWHKNTKGYWVTSKRKDDDIQLLHVLIMTRQYGKYDTKEFDVDHLNRNPSDNRRENLELKTHIDNMKNQSKRVNNTSGKTGVYKEKNKWRSSIYVNGQKINLGVYEKFEDAVEARINAENKYNFIGE